MQCVCSDQLNIQLKAVLAIKHLSMEDITFQQYMQACPGALKILEDIAAPTIVPQARSLEPQEVKTVRDATQSAVDAITTPHTVEKQTESASLKQRIQGFGNYEPPPDELEAKPTSVGGQVAEFVGDSIGDVVDDFREKGAVGALKDATIDALDLVLDGVDAVWGWVVGGKGEDQNRICQPNAMQPGQPCMPGQVPMGFQPPTRPQTNSASTAYGAAFGGGVVGANNPVMLGGPGQLPGLSAGMPGGLLLPAPNHNGGMGYGGAMPSAAMPNPAHVAAPTPEPAPAPVPVVDLLSMDEPVKTTSFHGTSSNDTSGDLLDMGSPSNSQNPSAASQAAAVNMLDF